MAMRQFARNGFTLLNGSGTALTGAATVTIGNLPACESILVVVFNASSASASSSISMRVNGISSSSYNSAGLYIQGLSAWNATGLRGDQGLRTEIQLGIMSGNAGSFVGGYTRIDGASSGSSSLKTWMSAGSGNEESSNGQRAYIQAGAISNCDPISSVSLVSSTGNFDSGTVYVYGMLL